MNHAISSLRILPAEIESPAASTNQEGSDFIDTLRGAMDQVNELQSAAEEKIHGLLNGSGMDVHTAMIAVEKADLSFQLMMQVRNKIVQAYQDISRLQF